MIQRGKRTQKVTYETMTMEHKRRICGTLARKRHSIISIKLTFHNPNVSAMMRFHLMPPN